MINTGTNVWIKKYMVVIVLFLSFYTIGYSQEDYNTFKEKARKQYGAFQKQASESYTNFRQKANTQYAEFMLKSWEKFHVTPSKPKPPCPDPVKPPVKENPEEKSIDNPVPYGKVEPLPEPQKQPQPFENIPIDSTPGQQQYLKFTFYNVSCKVSWSDQLKFQLPDITDTTLNIAWGVLSGKEYNKFVVDCIKLRTKLSLCDWAYIELLQKITEEIYQSPRADESVFLQLFVLCQTGYKVRFARSDESKLVLLISTNEITDLPGIVTTTDTLYVVDSDSKAFDVPPVSFPYEKPLSLSINFEPILDQSETNNKEFKAERCPVANAKTGTNKGLIDFYNSYPYCDWKIHANTPLSETIRNNIYPVLEYAISNKSETEAANILIDFVQTAFKYKTDEEQFGFEKPFFPDELFYYPYSDCEDRAILYSILVRDLLHLNVVLLHYPNHLATAVHFNQEVEGDYLIVNNLKYLVCDPTYIGAPIGDAMPQFKNTVADVVVLTTKN